MPERKGTDKRTTKDIKRCFIKLKYRRDNCILNNIYQLMLVNIIKIRC